MPAAVLRGQVAVTDQRLEKPAVIAIAGRACVALFFASLALYQFPSTRIAVLDKQVPYFAPALVAVIAVAMLTLGGRQLRQATPALAVLLLLAIATCVTGLAHPDQDWGEALKRLAYIAVGALLLAMGARDRATTTAGLYTYTLVAAGMAVVGFVLLAQGVGEASQAFYFGLHYTSSTRNGDAYFMLVPAFTALGFWSTPTTPPALRWPAGLALTVLLAGLLLSFSRGAWLATTAGLVVFLVLARGYRRPLVAALAVITVAAGLSFSQLSPIPVGAMLVDRAATIAQLSDAPTNSSAERLRLLDDSVRLIADNPLTGAGVGLLPRAYGHMPDVLGLAHAEDAYVTVLAEYGAPGLSAIIVFIAWPLARLRPRPGAAVDPLRLAIFCGLLAAALNALTDNPVTSASYWILPLFLAASG